MNLKLKREILKIQKNTSRKNYWEIKAELTQFDTREIVPRNNEELFLTRHWPWPSSQQAGLQKQPKKSNLEQLTKELP